MYELDQFLQTINYCLILACMYINAFNNSVSKFPDSNISFTKLGILFKITQAHAGASKTWCSRRDLNPGSPARKAGMLGRATPQEQYLLYPMRLFIIVFRIAVVFIL